MTPSHQTAGRLDEEFTSPRPRETTIVNNLLRQALKTSLLPGDIKHLVLLNILLNYNRNSPTLRETEVNSFFTRELLLQAHPQLYNVTSFVAGIRNDWNDCHIISG